MNSIWFLKLCNEFWRAEGLERKEGRIQEKGEEPCSQISGNALKKEDHPGESTSAAILLLSPNGAPDASTWTSPLFIFRSALVEWWCWSCLSETLGVLPIMNSRLYCGMELVNVKKYFRVMPLNRSHRREPHKKEIGCSLNWSLPKNLPATWLFWMLARSVYNWY